jgi:hypothetical protein
MRTDDDHYFMLSPSKKAWIHNNMRYVCERLNEINITHPKVLCICPLLYRYAVLQLHRTEGNVIINCKNGRTRSPMYLVAYLIVCYEMEPPEAHRAVELLVRERHLVLDRDDRLLHVVESMI